MSLTLWYHPLASYCWKVLIALYELDRSFETKFVDFGDAESRDAFFAKWPLGKMPVLEDGEKVIPETSVIIEYLARDTSTLIPADPDAALEVRLWDRLFDGYVMSPMQKIVLDRIRPADARDAFGVEEARGTLESTYAVIEREYATRPRGAFTLADCAAAPALFYAEKVQPFTERFPALAQYYAWLMARPSVKRTIAEAEPYFNLFPTENR